MISYSWESLQCLKLSSNGQIHRTDHLKDHEYLKGLSLVPSSEGFTITAFLPAYLSEIRRWNGSEISVILPHNIINHRATGSSKELHLPESSRTTLPPFMIFPMTTSERNSTFRSHLNQDFNGGIPSKTLGGSEQDKITSICPSWTWSSSGRIPAPCPEMKAIEICSYYSLGMNECSFISIRNQE